MRETRSPLQAQIVQWRAQPGDLVVAGDVLVILEAMKMEHEVRATHPGRMSELYFAAGESVAQGDVLLKSELFSHISRGLQADLTISAPVKTAAVVKAASGVEAAGAVRADLQKLQKLQERQGGVMMPTHQATYSDWRSP